MRTQETALHPPPDGLLNQEMQAIITDYDKVVTDAQPTNVRRVFWEQQVSGNMCTAINKYRCTVYIQQKKSVQVHGAQELRWHPHMIRLCIKLKYYSSDNDIIMRKIVHPPSARMLRDHTN